MSNSSHFIGESEPVMGFYWHVHHHELIEYCYDLRKRVEHIKTQKPEGEQKLRLQLLHPVRGKLPEAVVEAGQALGEAYRAWYKAKKVWGEAKKAQGEAYRARNEADRVWDEKRRAWHEAYRGWTSVFAEHHEEIKALHAIECPDCPWDGESIFAGPITPA